MQRKFKNLLLAATAIFAFSAPTFGQLQTTFETVSEFAGSITSNNTGRAFIQTFNSASALQSVTYRFATLNPGSFAGTSFNAYFTRWNPATGQAIGPAISSSTIQVGDVGVTAQTGFTNFLDANSSTYRGLDFQFNLNATLQSDLTYAMILVGLNSSAIGLAVVDNVDAFAFGESLKRNSGVSTNLATGFANLTTGSSTQVINDWGFSAIAITIVPEPSTAAAALVAGFVGIMVIRRRLQRNKLQPVTVA